MQGTGTVAVSSSILFPFILKNWYCFVGIGECLKFYMWLFVDYNSSNVISSGETVSKNDSKFLKKLFQSDLVKVIQAKLTLDTCHDFLSQDVVAESVDVVVSNPPYVLRKDLANLAPEIVL